ncbi:MAG: uroporphyrinogen decarboxylase family protein [Bryobacteraceae bacterium]
MTLRRRELFVLPALLAAKPGLTARERVDRAAAGQDVDRPPLSLWHHFGLEKFGAARHAEATLRFHRDYSTDLVKVMSDFPYPKPAGTWYELTPQASPFPEQLKALDIIRRDLNGKAHFIETIFNPWNVAEKLSSKEEVLRLMRAQPGKLLEALGAIARSEANHARLAIAGGASGIFLAIANAQDGILTRGEYRKFSEPFDRIVLDAVDSAPLNVLHLHGDKVWLDSFLSGWTARVVNYSAHGTGVSILSLRAKYRGVLMGGVDERNYRQAGVDSLRQQVHDARTAAGAKLIVTPGCSVPNESTPAELKKLAAAIRDS